MLAVKTMYMLTQWPERLLDLDVGEWLQLSRP
jgi:hypothetical protein